MGDYTYFHSPCKFFDTLSSEKRAFIVKDGMNTRKIVLLTVPVIVVVLLVLGALLTLILTQPAGPTPAAISDEQAMETPAQPPIDPNAETPAVITSEPAQAETAPTETKPRVIYENRE